MTHRGILTTRPNDAGVRAGFELTADRVVVTSDSESYVWAWDDVRIAPWDTTTVRLELADGEFFYRADDPLRFADALERATTGADRVKNGHWWDAVFSTHRPSAAPEPTPRVHPSNADTRMGPAEPTPSLSERAASIDVSDPWQPPESAVAEAAPTRAKRRRRFGRPKEHAHRWTENTVNGGIVRRVCQECRYVSIDLRASDPIPAG